jgi:hypothetical protein
MGVILFAASIINLSIGNSTLKCDDPVSCTQEFFSILMGLNFNVFQPIQDITAQYIMTLFIRFFVQILIGSLLVGVIFAERKTINDEQE